MEDRIDEKSVSIAQQALMGQAYAVKIGVLDPSDLNPKYKNKILEISKRMSLKELKKFATTKHKGLPSHVSEGDLNEKYDVSESPKVVTSEEMPKFIPKGPGNIIPFLNPDSKKEKKGKGNLENLKDYRDWIEENKS